MKLSESWLREWVNPDLTRDDLCHRLTMGGFEVEAIERASEEQSDADYIIEISITPNRGDCLSVRGMAREASALTRTPITSIKFVEMKPSINDTFPVSISAKAECPRYIGRIIRDVKANIETPAWMKEKLRCSGINSISPIVDVTNYVMMELGQPMHAFDLNTLDEKIVVRLSKKGEKISLLDGSEKILDDKTLVIADAKKPVAIAGVMGGLDSSVTLLTQDIFLESAFFSAVTVAKQRQYYGLNSDSASRFERGVDPEIQREAMERATQLILDIAGGKAGPLIEVIHKTDLPEKTLVKLPKDKVARVLGITISDADIENIFKRLQFQATKTAAFFNQDGWEVKIPSYRSDIAIAEDLIEEIARLYGYDKIPMHNLASTLVAPAETDAGHLHTMLRQSLCDQGFHEIVSYSFIDKKLQVLLDPGISALELMNPISAEMAVMRTNLLPGLISTMLYNKSRQQHRVRLFEIGMCFTSDGKSLSQQPKLAGLLTGLAFPEQWGMPSREADFFDMKAHVVNLLKVSYDVDELIFKPISHPAMHPGQTAGIYHQEQQIGVVGAIHPAILQALDLPQQTNIFVFELALNQLPKTKPWHFKEISKFPEIRRDLAILVNQAIPVKAIQDTISITAGDWLKDVFIFDVYQGKGVSPGLKSVALALVLQHPTRTLVDEEVTKLMEKVILTLKGQFGAELRS
jgi:phenylalanyl-tRNA synthetase beta chain